MADESYLSAMSAWHNQQVQATTGKGNNIRPKYRKFEEFYDQKKVFESVFVKTERNQRLSKMAQINRLMNERGGHNG